MKLISFTVPCYNSQEYMRKCINSLLVGGDDVEIIIVNDGSKDDTLKIANEYAEKYPEIVKIIDKENGGHGSGVNAGLKLATGLYNKVVDSDDWLDASALEKLLNTIKEHYEANTLPDAYITNYVYEHVLDNTTYLAEYRNNMPSGKLIGWNSVKNFRYSKVLMMHAILYKREKLLESDTVLPEHTFYVDNIYMYKPMPFIKTLYYLDVDLYRYFIGRSDQSITIDNLLKRYEQQIRVTLCMVDAYKWDEIKKMPKGLKNYMWQVLNAVMSMTLFYICSAYSKERKTAYKEMWEHIKRNDRKMYNRLRHGSYSTLVVYLPWKVRGAICMYVYKVLCKKKKMG